MPAPMTITFFFALALWLADNMPAGFPDKLTRAVPPIFKMSRRLGVIVSSVIVTQTEATVVPALRINVFRRHGGHGCHVNEGFRIPAAVLHTAKFGPQVGLRPGVFDERVCLVGLTFQVRDG